jgi:hypothetical protein
VPGSGIAPDRNTAYVFYTFQSIVFPARSVLVDRVIAGMDDIDQIGYQEKKAPDRRHYYSGTIHEPAFIPLTGSSMAAGASVS